MKRNVYVTSDWHCGHEKSLIYDKRPFRDLKHMHEVLINNYNSTVTPNDICYFLGDVGWKDAVQEVIPQLNGRKILILGNHDPSKGSMYDAGFELVLNGAMITLGDHIITLSHCPLRGIKREDITGMVNGKPGENWHGETRHQRFSFPDFGQFALSGHIHSSPTNGKQKTQGRQYDVGVCGNGYRPVSMSAIESWITKTLKEEKENGAQN